MILCGEEVVLEILPLEKVLLHENCDELRVEKLVRRFSREKMLRNPLIVTPARGEDKFIALDGANRYCALRRAGCPDLLAQLVDYSAPGLELQTWYHALQGADKKDLIAGLKLIVEAKLSKIEPSRAAAFLETGRNCCAIFCPPDEALLIEWEPRRSTLADILNRIIETYETRCEIVRISSHQLKALLADPDPERQIVVGYPRLSPEDICAIALNGQKLPAGITKHVLPKRALRVNLPIDLLKADLPLGEKNRLLEKMIQERRKNGSIRYYAEPVVIFDE